MTVSQFEEFKKYMKDLIESPESTKAKESNNKTEFSKKWLIIITIISMFFTSLSYILSFMEKNPVEALSIELIKILWTTNGSSFIAYALQNSARAWSLNMSPNNNYSEGS